MTPVKRSKTVDSQPWWRGPTDSFSLFPNTITVSRFAETRARHKPEGIHSQSGRRLRRVGRSIRRRAHDPEFGAGAAGAGTGHDFLGRLFRYRGEAFRPRFWQNYRSGLRRTRGQLSERTCLDVARLALCARKYLSGVSLSFALLLFLVGSLIDFWDGPW